MDITPIGARLRVITNCVNPLLEVDLDLLYDYRQNDLDDFVLFAQYVSEDLAQQAKSSLDS